MTAMTLKRVFHWKIGGVRWIEILGVACVAVMLLSVYLAKAGAARESARIADLERRITESDRRVRLLRAEAAHLEQPARLEALSRRAGLAPVDVRRMAAEDQLPALAPAAGGDPAAGEGTP